MVRKYKKPKPLRKSWYQQKYSVQQLALKAFKGVKKIKKLINVEKKFVDSADTNPISSTGSIGLPIAGYIAQGDGIGQRDGNSVLGQSLYIQHQFKMHASAVDTIVRCIIFVDKQLVADTAPTSTPLLDSDDVEALYNYVNRPRFQILSDRRFVLNDAKSTSLFVNYTIPYNKHITWNGTAATDYQKGQVWMLLISTEATNTVTNDTRTRFTYTDN